MYATTSHTKRFPTQCRFFTQGNCRAGQDCHFAHTLPLQGQSHRHSVQHSILFGDEAALDLEPESIQKVRDIELDQLERTYKDQILKTIMTEVGTCLIMVAFDGLHDGLHDGGEDFLELLIPYQYPDVPCSIRLNSHGDTLSPKIKSIYEEFESYQHQLRHMTLVQQIDNLCRLFTTIPS